MYVTYQPFLDRMIQRYEGGYGWDSGDGGGPTKYGITCWDLAEYQHKKMTSMRAWAPVVKEMQLSTAEAIYWGKYALGINYSSLPAGIDCVMMDYAVNSGLSRPIRVARAILKVPGPMTRVDAPLVTAINKAGVEWFIDAMLDERLHFMRGLRNWHKFGGGWASRVADLRLYAKAVAKKTAMPPLSTQPTAEKPMPKANHDNPNIGKNITTTVGTSGTATVATHAAGLGWGWIMLLVVLLVLAGVAGYLYYQYKVKQANATVVLPPVKPPVTPAPAPTGATGPSK